MFVLYSAAGSPDAGAGANGGADASTPTEEKAFDVKAAAVGAASSGSASPGCSSPDPADLERIISLAESLQTRQHEVGPSAPRSNGDEADGDEHEMSDEEQFGLARRMRRVDISGRPVAVDMELIRPYKSLLYHGGEAYALPASLLRTCSKRER